MSETFALEVSDELAAKLRENDDVSDSLVVALRQVYGDGSKNPVAEKQAELQERMGLDTSDTSEDTDSAGEAELADLQREQLKAFLRCERTDGIEK